MLESHHASATPRQVCYLICAVAAYPAGKRPQHYLGYADDLDRRVQQHEAGRGSRLLRAMKQKNIEWEVVRIWENGSYSLEKELKRRHNSWQYCPNCANSWKSNRRPASVFSELCRMKEDNGQHHRKLQNVT